MKALPQSISSETHELSSSALHDLLKIHIETDDLPFTQRLCLETTLSWDGYVWSKVAFSLSGLGGKSGGEKSRPKLILPNPEGIYSYYIQKGYLDNARVTYFNVHPQDLENSEALIYQFYVNRILEVNRNMISLQLSHLSDGNKFRLPPRRFTQPEYNQVRI